jgi:hypothetical protein
MGFRNLSKTSEKSSSSPCAVGVVHKYVLEEKREFFHLEDTGFGAEGGGILRAPSKQSVWRKSSKTAKIEPGGTW